MFPCSLRRAWALINSLSLARELVRSCLFLVSEAPTRVKMDSQSVRVMSALLEFFLISYNINVTVINKV